MSKKSRFSSARSRNNYYNWFRGNLNWNPSKVTTYSKEEFDRLKEEEQRKHNKKS